MAQRKKPLKPKLVYDLHLDISQRAAEIANDRVMDPMYNGGLGPAVFAIQSPFRMTTNSSRIGVEFNAFVLPNILPEDAEALREIARGAIHQALIEKGEDFAGLIIGEARKGTNYFDKWHRV